MIFLTCLITALLFKNVFHKLERYFCHTITIHVSSGEEKRKMRMDRYILNT